MTDHKLERQDSPHSSIDWENHYKTKKDLPWDLKTPAPQLIEYFESTTAENKPKVAIEIGCGTGANAIWLAKNGCSVTATEIAETALQSAKDRAREQNSSIDFQLLDICERSPVAPASQDFAFDRGVYHIIPIAKRARFVESIASTLKPGAYWLNLAGSKDEVRENPLAGPPQLSALELLEHIEPHFEIIELGRTSFVLPDGSPHLAWKALYRRR